MTKFEKIAKRAELLELAYNAIIERNKWENMKSNDTNTYDPDESRKEECEFYISIAKEIEKML